MKRKRFTHPDDLRAEAALSGLACVPLYELGMLWESVHAAQAREITDPVVAAALSRLDANLSSIIEQDWNEFLSEWECARLEVDRGE